MLSSFRALSHRSERRESMSNEEAVPRQKTVYVRGIRSPLSSAHFSIRVYLYFHGCPFLGGRSSTLSSFPVISRTLSDRRESMGNRERRASPAVFLVFLMGRCDSCLLFLSRVRKEKRDYSLIFLCSPIRSNLSEILPKEVEKSL